MRFIIIILVLVAVGFYAKVLLPPEYFEKLEDKLASFQLPSSSEEKSETNSYEQLRDVPESQLLVIKQVFAPEMKD